MKNSIKLYLLFLLLTIILVSCKSKQSVYIKDDKIIHGTMYLHQKDSIVKYEF